MVTDIPDCLEVTATTAGDVVMGLRHKSLLTEGIQFHPEFLSRPNQPHPLFREFIAVAKRTLREGGQHELPIATADAGKKG